MEFSLKNSFKKHIRELSSSAANFAGGDSARVEGSDQEFQPILMNEDKEFIARQHQPRRPSSSDFVVKIDGGDVGGATTSRCEHNVMRGSSYDFWKAHNLNRGRGDNDGSPGSSGSGDDPTAELIGKFLDKQKAQGDVALDMDLEMNELRHDSDTTAAKEPPYKEVRVSFQTSPATNEINSHATSPGSTSSSFSSDNSPREDACNPMQGPSTRVSTSLRPESSRIGGGGAEVLKCTSNAKFQQQKSFLRMKTKSRLMDPPEEELEIVQEKCTAPRSSGILKSQNLKSSPFKSGMLGKAVIEEDEEDPFSDEDLPSDFKNSRLSVVSIIEWVIFCLIIAALVCSLAIPRLRKTNLKGLQIWKWIVLVAVFFCGRLVSNWGIRILVFFIERNFMLRKRVLYFVYGVRRAVRNCLWLGLVLVAWHFLFDGKVENETKTDFLKNVTRILVCCLLAAIIWLVKTLVVKVLASSFHMATYFERIQDALFNQFVIETLSGPPLIQVQRSKEEEDSMVAEMDRMQKAGIPIPPELRSAALPPTKSGRILKSGVLQKTLAGRSGKLSRCPSNKVGDGITIDHLHRLNHNNISAWNMKRLVNMVRYGALTTLDEQVLEATGGDESATQIRSEREAKAAAKKIFKNVAKPESKHIYLDDLLCFMREDEALRAMNLFEGAIEKKRISRSSLKNWVVNAFRERRALALTLNDTKTAVNKLHRMVNALVLIIIIVVWLLVLNIATKNFLALVSTQILLVAFVFGNTCKTIFESIIFLFVLHPFDVGDRCEVDGIQLVVEEMNILTTVFLRFDNQKITYPNSTLLAKPIGNYYRSPDMGDAVEFCVHIHTPAEKIALIKQKIVSYIENKKEHWYTEPMVVFKDFEALNMVRIAVWPRQKMNFQDMGEKFIRRGLLIEEMVKIFRELDIYYRMLPLDINVKTMPPVDSTRYPSTWTPAAN